MLLSSAALGASWYKFISLWDWLLSFINVVYKETVLYSILVPEILVSGYCSWLTSPHLAIVDSKEMQCVWTCMILLKLSVSNPLIVFRLELLPL
jgi:hypothetical protein